MGPMPEDERLFSAVLPWVPALGARVVSWITREREGGQWTAINFLFNQMGKELASVLFPNFHVQWLSGVNELCLGFFMPLVCKTNSQRRS